MNINEHRIREFAYQIWQSEGCPDGQAHRHWEMACSLAAADQTAQYTTPSQQKIPDAPQHTTVSNNDMDSVNKPQNAKTKALQKSLGAAKKDMQAATNEHLLPSDRRSATPTTKRLKQKQDELSATSDTHAAPAVAKPHVAKSNRRKKADLLTDVVNTELPKI